MRKCYYLLLLLLLCSSFGFGQNRKSVSILGDSYSTFEGYLESATHSAWYTLVPKHKTDVTSVKQTWWHKFVKENGYQLCVNNSFSGATVCRTGYEGKDYTDRSFITRMDKLGRPDITFVFGGTNDSWANAPMGECMYADWSKDDLFKFRPAMCYMLDRMIDYYPNVEIYFILNTGLKAECNESVRTICKYYGIHCIELSDIDKLSGHPSVAGMAQICEQVKRG